MNNNLLCNSAINLSREIFGKDELLIAFVSGSRAIGGYKKYSDIDIFIILKSTSYEKEKEFAGKLKEFHLINNLKFDHYGEIFSKETLDSLLTKTNLTEILINNRFCEMACFQTQCILSIARKLLVVLSMLHNQKRFVAGDEILLESYERIAKDFFGRNTNLSLKTTDYKIDWNNSGTSLQKIKNKWNHFNKLITNNNFLDTPIGIGLERWFSKDFETPDQIDLQQCKEFLNQEIPNNLCPSGKIVNSKIQKLINSQCLGI